MQGQEGDEEVTHLAELAGKGVVTAQAVDLTTECGTVAATRNGRLGHEDAAAQGGNMAGSIARRSGSGDRTGWRQSINKIKSSKVKLDISLLRQRTQHAGSCETKHIGATHDKYWHSCS